MSHARRGCRCEVCRAANTLNTKKWRVRRSRGEVYKVDATEPRRMLRRLNKKLPLRRITELTGIPSGTIKHISRGSFKYVTSLHAKAIESLYEDYFGDVEVEKDTRRYPVEPLEEHIRKRFDPEAGLGDVWRSRLSKGRRHGISAESADRYAVELGLEPSQLWFDYGLQEAS